MKSPEKNAKQLFISWCHYCIGLKLLLQNHFSLHYTVISADTKNLEQILENASHSGFIREEALLPTLPFLPLANWISLD